MKYPRRDTYEDTLRNFVPVIRNIANKYCIVDDSKYADLVQVGRIGLWRAYEGFDTVHNCTFYTHAVNYIRFAILDELRALDCISRRDRRQIRLAASGSKTVHEMYSASEARLLDVAQHISHVSIDAEGNMEYLEIVDEPRQLETLEGDAMDDQRFEALMASLLSDCRPKLSAREFEIFKARISGESPSSIARWLGVTDTRVSQIWKICKRKVAPIIAPHT